MAACSPQRVIAGLVFLPLLAYAFPPFLVADLPFYLRLLFWTGVMVLGLSVTWLSGKLIQGKLDRMQMPLRDFANVVLILALFTPSLWLLAWLLFTYGDKMPPELSTVASYSTLLVTGLVLLRRSEQGKPEVAEETSAPSPRLVNRLPQGFEGEIYRLTVRDHNVDVVTSQGTFTIRSRFTDAIAEMEPIPGHCTHRSHWVTDASIIRVDRRDGKIYLRLKNGDLVPVSRKYKPMLEEDGLLGP